MGNSQRARDRNQFGCATDNKRGAGSPLKQLQLTTSNDARGIHMFEMHACRQRLCKHVGHVVVRSYLAHLDVAVGDVLAHLQIAPIDMSRALTRASLFRELDCPRVVDVHRRGLRLLAPLFCKQAPEMYHFSGGVRGGYDLSFGR
eukprot:174241-Pleurochrysis_carterae.AAC.2